jgi:predicted SnoaL-like aldol condensation-catalyzing enzyme
MATPRVQAPCISQNRSTRSPVAFVIGLGALITGPALLLAGVLLEDLEPLPRRGSVVAETQRAASEFYAAQDEALATGDTRRLTAVVAPYFVDHRPGAASEQHRQGLVDEMTALRHVRPGVRLTAEAFVVDGDRVLVYVSLHPTGHHGRANTMSPALSADTIEVVRIVDGVVTERWSLDGVPGPWPAAIVTPTAVPPWSSSRFATATAAGQVCGASHCS